MMYQIIVLPIIIICLVVLLYELVIDYIRLFYYDYSFNPFTGAFL